MKMVILAIAAAMFLGGHAFAECIDYEFAELNKMTEQQLVQAYDDNRKEKFRINQDASGKETTGSLSSAVRTQTENCDKYSDKIVRAFKSKFPYKKIGK